MNGNENKSTHQRKVIKRRLQGNLRGLLEVLLLVTIRKVNVQRRRYSLHDLQIRESMRTCTATGAGLSEFSDEDI